jgi:alanine dehydrogenase
VPNCPTFVARSASHSLTNVLSPYLLRIHAEGLHGALRSSRDLQRGCYSCRGKLVSPHVTDNPHSLEELIGKE